MAPDQPFPASPAHPPVKPRGFSGVVGIAIALGILGLLSGLFGLASLLGTPAALSGTFARMNGNVPVEQARLMNDFHAKIQAATLTPFSVALAAVGLLIAIWVLVATRAWLGRRPEATGGFRAAIATLGVLELAVIPNQIVVYLRTSEIMREFQTAIFHNTGGRALPPGFERIMGTIMGAAVVAGVVIGVLWSIAKIGCCVYARQYAGKPEVRAWVDGAPRS